MARSGPRKAPKIDLDDISTPGEGEICSLDEQAVDLTDHNESLANERKRARAPSAIGAKKSNKTLTGKKESHSGLERTLQFGEDDGEHEDGAGADNGQGFRTTGLPGHVKSIELVDFMCHDHMTMDFAPHCTFISGKNGSGKSASLQALQCSLGVKATKHGKNASLSKLIRTGQEEAIINVTIWNKPTRDYEAYRHEVYGDFITIERRISKQHSWAFKSANGKVISRKKDELEQILHTLNLNASNPVTVMTQNTARGLLGSTTAKADHEKYDLYMDATQLGTIAENIAKTKESLGMMSEHVEKISRAYGDMEDKVNNAKARRDKLVRIEDLKDEMADLEIVFAMEIILEQEAMRDDLNERLKGLDSEDAGKLLEESNAKLDALNKRLEEIQELDAQHALKSKDATNEAQQLMKELKERKKELQLNKKKIGRFGGLMQEAREEKHAAEKALEALKENNENRDGDFESQEKENQALNEHLQQLDQATKAKTKAIEAQQKYQRLYQVVLDNLEKLKGESRELNASLKSCSHQKAQLERQLAQQTAASKGSIDEFGSMAAKLVAAIDKAHSQGRFSAKPLGPLGRYLGLKDRTYAMSVEVAIGNHLESYLVTSQRDLEALNKVFLDAGVSRNSSYMPRIGVTNFGRHKTVYDVQPSQMPGGPTVLSVLTCEESVKPIVLNYLIDIATVEKLALAPSASASMDECQQLAKRPNVSALFDCQGNRYTHRGSSVAFDGIDRWKANRGPRLGLSKQEKMKELQRRIRDAAEEASRIQQEHSRVLAACKGAETECSDNKKKMIAAQLEVDKARGTINMLETTRDGLQEITQAPEEGFLSQIQTQAANIIQFQSKVEDAKARIESLKGEIGTLEERREELTKQLDARDDSHEMLKESHASVKKEIKKIEQYIAKLNQIKDVQDGKRSQWKQQVKDIQDAIDQSMETTLAIVESRENAADRKQHLVDKYRSKGLSKDEIKKMFTRKALEKKYQHLAKTIEEAEEEAGGNLADLEVEVANAEEKLIKDGHDMRKNLALFKGLQEAYKKREAKLFQVDDYVENTVSARFKHYMRKKGHFGKIAVHRKEKKLEIGVRIGQDKNKDAVIKDLKQLSGGERSFATVAFALALGGESDTPFRAMDEFDVFMDSVNRKIAMENLITFAAENPDLQFIFLTPQDLRYASICHPISSTHITCLRISRIWFLFTDVGSPLPMATITMAAVTTTDDQPYQLAPLENLSARLFRHETIAVRRKGSNCRTTLSRSFQ